MFDFLAPFCDLFPDTAQASFELQEKKVYYNTPNRIAINKSYDSALWYATDKQLAEYLTQCGTIIYKISAALAIALGALKLWH